MMLEELERRNYSDRTKECYLHAVEDFSRYFNMTPDRLGPEHIRQFQAHLFTDRKLAPNTVNQRLAALRFFYVNDLGRRVFAPVSASPASQGFCPNPKLWLSCESATLDPSASLLSIAGIRPTDFLGRNVFHRWCDSCYVDLSQMWRTNDPYRALGAPTARAAIAAGHSRWGDSYSGIRKPAFLARISNYAPLFIVGEIQ